MESWTVEQVKVFVEAIAPSLGDMVQYTSGATLLKYGPPAMDNKEAIKLYSAVQYFRQYCFKDWEVRAIVQRIRSLPPSSAEIANSTDFVMVNRAVPFPVLIVDDDVQTRANQWFAAYLRRVRGGTKWAPVVYVKTFFDNVLEPFAERVLLGNEVVVLSKDNRSGNADVVGFSTNVRQSESCPLPVSDWSIVVELKASDMTIDAGLRQAAAYVVRRQENGRCRLMVVCHRGNIQNILNPKQVPLFMLQRAECVLSPDHAPHIEVEMQQFMFDPDIPDRSKEFLGAAMAFLIDNVAMLKEDPTPEEAVLLI